MSKKLIFTFGLVFYFVVTFSQVPGTLSYQGLLLDASNNPVADGANTITFRFYNVETGGTYDATIGERTLSVQTFKGLFTAILGDGTAGNLALPSLVGSQQYWIGVTPLGGSELTPRVRLSTVPYAFRAQTVNAVDAASITTGTLPNTVLDADLIDLSDGTLSGATLSLSGTDASKLATGTTAQRPVSPVEGQIRYNSTEKVMEYYNGTNWYFMTPKVIILKDVKAAGTYGGTSVAGTWATRDLQTIEPVGGDLTVISSFSSNQFTLTPGEYIVTASAPVYIALEHKIRLQDVIGNVTWGLGSNAYSQASDHSYSDLISRFIITSSTKFELQHRVTNATAGQGFGTIAVMTGVQEVYAQVVITKLR